MAISKTPLLCLLLLLYFKKASPISKSRYTFESVTMSTDTTCRHVGIDEFDGLRSCLGCGETGFIALPSGSDPLYGKEAHIHAPLDRSKFGEVIRLIKINPGEFGSPIHCTLETASLQDAVYDAVSYA